MIAVGHTPLRPSWLCVMDGKPWPCDPAREEMADDCRITRAIMMSVMLDLAAGDMPTATPGELFERFVAWTRATPVAGSDIGAEAAGSPGATRTDSEPVSAASPARRRS
jgi:hypothetical protein